MSSSRARSSSSFATVRISGARMTSAFEQRTVASMMRSRSPGRAVDEDQNVDVGLFVVVIPCVRTEENERPQPIAEERPQRLREPAEGGPDRRGDAAAALLEGRDGHREAEVVLVDLVAVHRPGPRSGQA